MRLLFIASLIAFTGCSVRNGMTVSPQIASYQVYAQQLEACNAPHNKGMYKKRTLQEEYQRAVQYRVCVENITGGDPARDQTLGLAYFGEASYLAQLGRTKESRVVAVQGIDAMRDPECVSLSCASLLDGVGSSMVASGGAGDAIALLEPRFIQLRAAGNVASMTMYNRGMTLATAYAENRQNEKALALGLEVLNGVSPSEYAENGRSSYPLIVLTRSAAILGKRAEVQFFLTMLVEASEEPQFMWDTSTFTTSRGAEVKKLLLQQGMEKEAKLLAPFLTRSKPQVGDEANCKMMYKIFVDAAETYKAEWKSSPYRLDDDFKNILISSLENQRDYAERCGYNNDVRTLEAEIQSYR